MLWIFLSSLVYIPSGSRFVHSLRETYNFPTIFFYTNCKLFRVINTFSFIRNESYVFAFTVVARSISLRFLRRKSRSFNFSLYGLFYFRSTKIEFERNEEKKKTFPFLLLLDEIIIVRVVFIVRSPVNSRNFYPWHSTRLFLPSYELSIQIAISSQFDLE